MTPAHSILISEAAIALMGWRLEYRDFCEDGQTPGILGTIGGKTSHSKRLIVVSTVVNDTPEKQAKTLAHELHHALDPTWDCGNVDTIGRPSHVGEWQ